MRVIILTAIIHYTMAGYNSPCEIEGVSKTDWLNGKRLKMKVPDNQEFAFVQFNTQHIIGISKLESTYLNATYADNTLYLFPNQNFKSFEEDYKSYGTPVIEVVITFKCLNDTSEAITIQAVVEDVNDNAPVFSEEVYEYHFEMAIPENYLLTHILPISAIDSDFTNDDIFFTMEFNMKFRLQYKGRPKYYNDRFFTSLQALMEIRAPFYEEFTLIATDSGSPPRQSKARLIISVSSNTSQSSYHSKPFFSKPVYLAQYSSNDLHLQEPIQLENAESLVLMQRSLRDYFQIEMNSEQRGLVKTLRPLPKTLVKSRKFVVVEMEVVNQAFQSLDSAALLIRFQDNCEDDDLHSHCLKLWNLYGTTWWFLLLYAALIATTLILNRGILIRRLRFNRRSSILIPH
ncbi:hypothetical protein PPYR_10346 [Photinus pyralis]|uniref:Cadherin domain-containing protein n=1 Tax=Photinus pyralis TaxID=7054 RepID=A0A1Y1N0C1_PHOPY|nr:protocadherin Fat 4-like [Photinus pyralis]KAB0796285.1 hypothetical protein PPYR_10346 [Photinus pyralis]